MISIRGFNNLWNSELWSELELRGKDKAIVETLLRYKAFESSEDESSGRGMSKIGGYKELDWFSVVVEDELRSKDFELTALTAQVKSGKWEIIEGGSISFVQTKTILIGGSEWEVRFKVTTEFKSEGSEVEVEADWGSEVKSNAEVAKPDFEGASRPFDSELQKQKL